MDDKSTVYLKKRIIFEVSEEFHRDIKVAAAYNGMSMNCWIHRALYERLKKESDQFSKTGPANTTRG